MGFWQLQEDLLLADRLPTACHPNPLSRLLQSTTFTVPLQVSDSDKWQFLIQDADRPSVVSALSAPLTVESSMRQVSIQKQLIRKREYSYSWECSPNPQVSSVQVLLMEASSESVSAILHGNSSFTCPSRNAEILLSWCVTVHRQLSAVAGASCCFGCCWASEKVS